MFWTTESRTIAGCTPSNAATYTHTLNVKAGLTYSKFIREEYQSVKREGNIKAVVWTDKSTTSYDMLYFKCYIKSLTRKYLVIERHMLQIQFILLQHLKLNWTICPLSITFILFNF